MVVAVLVQKGADVEARCVSDKTELRVDWCFIVEGYRVFIDWFPKFMKAGFFLVLSDLRIPLTTPKVWTVT